jgi:hypothetical protein
MKKTLIIFFILISSSAFSQVETGWRFIFEGGVNVSTYFFGDLSAGIRYRLLPKTSLLLNFAVTNYQFAYSIITPGGSGWEPGDYGTPVYTPEMTENFKITNYFLQLRTGLSF